MFDDESLNALNSRIEANANKLIDMGAREWYRTCRKHTRRKRKHAKTQQDQLREIEEGMVEDNK